jgi:chromosome segregation ATPase
MDIQDKQQEITRLKNEIKNIDAQIAACNNKVKEVEDIGVFLLKKLAVALHEKYPENEKANSIEQDILKIDKSEDDEYRTKITNFVETNAEEKDGIHFGNKTEAAIEEKKRLQKEKRKLTKLLRDLQGEC